MRRVPEPHMRLRKRSLGLGEVISIITVAMVALSAPSMLWTRQGRTERGRGEMRVNSSHPLVCRLDGRMRRSNSPSSGSKVRPVAWLMSALILAKVDESSPAALMRKEVKV